MRPPALPGRPRAGSSPPRRARRVAWAIGAGLTVGALGAVWAQTAPPAGSGSVPPPTSGAPAAPAATGPDAGTDDAGGNVYSSCVEFLPEGATRPKLVEKFPTKGLAGYALPLEIEIEHGAGETVLPQGFSLQARGVEADALGKGGFMVPSPDGGAPPVLSPMSLDGGVRTRLVINVVALPKKAGRHELVLPPLPLAVSRASGEMMTLCTQAHAIVVDDPTANTPDARPKPNPPARRQREHWDALERAFYFGLVALVAGVTGALIYRWWRRRPRPEPPPPPPRPAWDVALEALYLLRDGQLLRDNRRAEYVDAVSDIIRRYLGDRYGFDGMEATSREVRRALRAVTPPLTVLPEVERMLDESDLIKFARVTPSPEECAELFALGEAIVKSTIPERQMADLDVKKEGAQ